MVLPLVPTNFAAWIIWTQCLSDKYPVDVVYLDFYRKPLIDSVAHKYLYWVAKLYSCGMIWYIQLAFLLQLAMDLAQWMNLCLLTALIEYWMPYQSVDI